MQVLVLLTRWEFDPRDPKYASLELSVHEFGFTTIFVGELEEMNFVSGFHLLVEGSEENVLAWLSSNEDDWWIGQGQPFEEKFTSLNYRHHQEKTVDA